MSYLATYLNDRNAILTAGTELARRAVESNRGGPYEAALEQARAALEADHELLRAQMTAQGVKPDRLKSSLAWLGEKLGRLKPNDQLTGYSPLSRVVELDGLTAILTVVAGSWEALTPHLDDERLPAAAVRARRALEGLDGVRADALRETLS
jgi:hypothetical protein